MTSGQTTKALIAALAAIDAGKLEVAKQLISKVIESLQARRHK